MAAKQAVLNLASKVPDDIFVDDELGSSSSDEPPEQRGSYGSRRSEAEGSRGRRKGDASPRRGKSPTREGRRKAGNRSNGRSLSPRRQGSSGSAAANKRAEVSALSRSNTTNCAQQQQAPLRRNRTDVPNADREGPALGRSRTTTNTGGAKKTRDRSRSPRRLNSKDMDRSRREGGSSNNPRTRRADRSPNRTGSRGDGRSRSPVRTNSRDEASPKRQPRGPCTKARSPRQVHAAQANQLLAALPEPVAHSFLNDKEPQQPRSEAEEEKPESEQEEEEEEEPGLEEEEDEEPRKNNNRLQRSEGNGGRMKTNSSSHNGRTGLSRAKAKREVRQTTGESKHTSSAIRPGMYRNLIQQSSSSP